MNLTSYHYHNYCMMDAPQTASWYSSPPEMICSICSDKAEGYHFGAISCAACGAFFRRSVSDQKVYACQARQCNIRHDPTKRGGSCRFCRFSKCLISGMMPQDVKAKRNATSSVLRSMSQPSMLIVDQIVGFRRSIAAERMHFETMASPITRSLFSSFLHQELENLKRISLGCPILNQLFPSNCDNSMVDKFQISSPNREIFLTIFIFESCYLTGSKGGVQLDRWILPNTMFIDVNENQFLEFLQYENVQNLDTVRPSFNCFSFLVQMVSRTFQTTNFDETTLSILFFTVISDIVPISFRNPYIESVRQSLWAEISQDHSTVPQFSELSRQIHEGVRVFKEAISRF